MRVSTLIALVPFAMGQQYMVNLDCTEYPGPCNNDCYAVYSAGKPVTLNYRGADGQTSTYRRKAGCISGSTTNPCRNGAMALPNGDEDTCDEYPYASTVEGGTGSLLRCTAGDENTAEGSQLSSVLSSNDGCGNEPCTFMVTFGNPGGGLTPYCLDNGGANDGFEYIYQGSENYQLGKRDSESEGGWALHEADPADHFPAHLRREFLLENGERTILGTRDLTTPYDDAIFLSLRNGTVSRVRAVKELRGLEKREELQDPVLRKAKRAVEFES